MIISANVTHSYPCIKTKLSFPHFDLKREDANILSCIPSTNIFIEAGIEAGGVLVHCFGGRSRSAAFIAAYLMCNCGWTYDKVISIILAARPVASINKGFVKQLRAYALTNYDVYATQQVLLRNRIKALHAIRGQNSANHNYNHMGGPWRENGKGGNKRLWGDRDSLGGEGIMLLIQQEKDRRAEEGRDDEKHDSDREESHEELNGCQGNSKIAPVKTVVVALDWYTNKAQYQIDWFKFHYMRFSLVNFLFFFCFHQYYLGYNEMEEDVQCDRKVYGAPASPEALPYEVKTISPPFSNSPFLKGSGVSSNNLSDVHLAVSPETPANIPIPYLDPKSPRCRLSRPGSSTVRVIPPLRGLEREVCCAHCGGKLFCLANVVRIEDNKVHQRQGEQDGARFSPANTSSSSVSNQNAPYTSSYFPSISSQLLEVEMKDLKRDFELDHKTSGIDRDYKNDMKMHSNGMNKDLRKDLKRDSDGEQKQESRASERTERTVLPCIASNYSERKIPPQSCRAAGAKKFDFDFGRPSGSVSVKHSSGRAAGGFRVGFENGDEFSRRHGAQNTLTDDCFEGAKGWRDSETIEESPVRGFGRRSVSENVLRGAGGWDDNASQFDRSSSSSQTMSVVNEEDEESKQKEFTGQNNKSNVNSSCKDSAESVGKTIPRLWGSERPQSAEKRRWLARMSLLSMNGSSTAFSTHPVVGSRQHDTQDRMRQIAQDDEEAMRLTFGGDESSVGDIQHLYLEYLGWMDPNGTVLGLPVIRSPGLETEIDDENDNDSGRIKCCHCQRVIGHWTWQPTAA